MLQALLADRFGGLGLNRYRGKRKNWLPVGSVQAGPKVAAILSVVESCLRLGVPVGAQHDQGLKGNSPLFLAQTMIGFSLGGPRP